MWTCVFCETNNEENAQVCMVCGSARKQATAEPPAKETPKPNEPIRPIAQNDLVQPKKQESKKQKQKAQEVKKQEDAKQPKAKEPEPPPRPPMPRPKPKVIALILSICLVPILITASWQPIETGAMAVYDFITITTPDAIKALLNEAVETKPTPIASVVVLYESEDGLWQRARSVEVAYTGKLTTIVPDGLIVPQGYELAGAREEYVLVSPQGVANPPIVRFRYARVAVPIPIAANQTPTAVECTVADRIGKPENLLDGDPFTSLAYLRSATTEGGKSNAVPDAGQPSIPELVFGFSNAAVRSIWILNGDCSSLMHFFAALKTNSDRRAF